MQLQMWALIALFRLLFSKFTCFFVLTTNCLADLPIKPLSILFKQNKIDLNLIKIDYDLILSQNVQNRILYILGYNFSNNICHSIFTLK